MHPGSGRVGGDQRRRVATGGCASTPAGCHDDLPGEALGDRVRVIALRRNVR